MTRITTSIHHYFYCCCCCGLDISNYTIRKEIFKNIYYTFVLALCIVYNVYYFNNVDLIIDHIDLLLGCMLLLSFSLILLYIINLIYLIFIILQNKKYVRLPRIVPIQPENTLTQNIQTPPQNIQMGVVVVNN